MLCVFYLCEMWCHGSEIQYVVLVDLFMCYRLTSVGSYIKSHIRTMRIFIVICSTPLKPVNISNILRYS